LFKVLCEPREALERGPSRAERAVERGGRGLACKERLEINGFFFLGDLSFRHMNLKVFP
jgi:hypothetical protein